MSTSAAAAPAEDLLDPVEGAGTTEALATFAAQLRYEELPEDVRHQAKRLIVDTLACVVGAHPYEAARIIEAVIAEMGGVPEARAIPAAIRTSAASAAYINGELANLLDLDDNLLNHTHFANTAVCAPLAVAEAAGSSGRDLIQAVVAAYEVSARLTLAQPNIIELSGEWPDVTERYSYTHGMGFGTVGAAAGCGNVLRLATGTMRHAFGLAGYSAPVPSTAKAAGDPSLPMKKYAPYGQIAWSAVVAARLADRGFTADTTVLDGPRGFWRMTGARSFDWDVAVGGLGERWWSLETSFKLVPICTWNRQPIRALKMILSEHTIDPVDIESIEVRVHPTAAKLPPWVLAQPANHLETQFSHPWAMAMTALSMPPPLWQQPQTLVNREALRLAALTKVVPEPEAQRAYFEQTGDQVIGVRRVRRSPSTVTLRLRNGQEHSASVEYADGDPFTPETRATDDQLHNKLVTFGELAVDRDRLVRAADLLFDLDNVDNVGDVVALLCVKD